MTNSTGPEVNGLRVYYASIEDSSTLHTLQGQGQKRKQAVLVLLLWILEATQVSGKIND